VTESSADNTTWRILTQHFQESLSEPKNQTNKFVLTNLPERPNLVLCDCFVLQKLKLSFERSYFETPDDILSNVDKNTERTFAGVVCQCFPAWHTMSAYRKNSGIYDISHSL